MNVMLGASWQQRAAESVEATSQNFSDDFYQWHNLGAGTVTIPSKSDDYAWSINSYFARINYTLKDRYLFTATGDVYKRQEYDHAKYRLCAEPRL